MALRLWMPLFALIAGTTVLGQQSGAPKAEAAQWSDLRGRIIWRGDEVPQPTEIKVGADLKCCSKDGPVTTEDWVINAKNRGVRWVYVWLVADPAKGPAKLPVHPALREVKPGEVVVKQNDCRFVPHATCLREGQKLIVKNRDPCVHTVRWLGDPAINGAGALNLLPEKATTDIGPLKAQRPPIALECHIHPWMRGWVRVFDHPYHVITDADGRFEIKHAPVGHWRLMVWHEGHGWRGQRAGKDGYKIEIKAGQPNDLGDWALNP